MMSKKAQQEIIVTVLLVLIALAAVAAVATFVIRNVQTSTAGAELKQKCLKVELSIQDVNVGDTSIIVKRLGSSADTALKDVKVFYDGASCNISTATGDFAAGTTKSIILNGTGISSCVTNVGVVATKKIEIAPIINDKTTAGYACDTVAEVVVANA